MPLPPVGARGFEPPTSASRTLRAAGLRYAPSLPEDSTAPPASATKSISFRASRSTRSALKLTQETVKRELGAMASYTTTLQYGDRPTVVYFALLLR
jgi:hypothetical protein